MLESDLTKVTVSENLFVYRGSVPFDLRPNFEELWNLHPENYPIITMFEKPVPLPRWQQAYGHDYFFSGQVSKALPIPDILKPLTEWVQIACPGINGLLINWYSGEFKHYIGAHRDADSDLVPGVPIVTVSFGNQRTFRLRKKGQAPVDLRLFEGDIIVLPRNTNAAMSHEVPHFAKDVGRRVSVTFRAFKPT